jgi:hypothetical protein
MIAEYRPVPAWRVAVMLMPGEPGRMQEVTVSLAGQSAAECSLNRSLIRAARYRSRLTKSSRLQSTVSSGTGAGVAMGTGVILRQLITPCQAAQLQTGETDDHPGR